MHARNVAAHPAAALAGVFDINAQAAEEVARALNARRSIASARRGLRFASRGRCGADRHLDRHPCRLHRARGRRGQGGALREADRSDAGARRPAAARMLAARQRPDQLGFVRRFDPGHRAVRDAVRAGEIGDLHQVIITSRDPAPAPRAYLEVSGGIFRDMTIHDFDMARFLLGEEPVEVFAMGGRQINPAMMDELDDHDAAMVILRTASGRLCHINNHRQAVYGYDQRVECLGNAGMLISDNRSAHAVRRYGKSFTAQSAPYMDFFIERYAEAFVAELSAFIDAVQNGRRPEVGFEDGRRALVLAEAAMKSVAEGRTVATAEIG